MDSYRRQQIRAKAQDVLNHAGVNALPVKPQELAAHFDIAVQAKPPSSSGASGWLVRVGDDFTIIYATHIDNKGFQNFCIAHELGHYWLEGHPEHIFRNSTEHMSHAGFGSSDRVEREADYFAACLLMPSSMCKPLVSSSVDGMAAVRKLANACETSLVAAALRYVEIGHVPSGVIVCRDARVEFCATYTLLKHVGWAHPLVRNSKIPIDCATWRLSDDKEAILRGCEDSDSASACDWFSGASTKASLIEEVIGLGRYGRTLTLLTLEEAEKGEDQDSDRWGEPGFR